MDSSVVCSAGEGFEDHVQSQQLWVMLPSLLLTVPVVYKLRLSGQGPTKVLSLQDGQP